MTNHPIAEQDSLEKLIADLRDQNERLRWSVCNEAADTLSQMRDALEPFAKAADGLGESWSDDFTICQHANIAPTLTFGHLRKARAALTTTKIEKE